VLCYPAHTTHLLQGLDVVVFAILKRMLSDERDRWERETGEMVSKSNFLGIYGRAHLRALTSETIKSAFRKTGIWPFNRNAISEMDMAPSKETSCEGHLLAIVGSEIDILAKLLQDLSVGPVAGADSEMDDVEGHVMVEDRENEVLGSTRQGVASGEDEGQSSASQTTSDPVDVVRAAFTSLSVGSLVHLFSNRHISSDLAAPPDVNWPIPGPSMHLRGFVPQTTIEEALLMALRDTEAGEDALKL
jgi:hypothetical protein